MIFQASPSWFRRTFNMDYLYACIKGLRDVYEYLIAFRSDVEYELQFTGQVIYLEHILNDKFDPVNRLIFIEDAADVEYLYIYNNSEPETGPYVYNNSETFNDLYLQTTSEQISNQAFIINIPSTGINQTQLKAVVDKYKLAGKIYSINIY